MMNSRHIPDIMKRSPRRAPLRRDYGELRPKVKSGSGVGRGDVDHTGPPRRWPSSQRRRAVRAQDTADSAQEIHSSLARGFGKADPPRRRDAEARRDAALGVYFEDPAPFMGRRCCQRVRAVPPPPRAPLVQRQVPPMERAAAAVAVRHVGRRGRGRRHQYSATPWDVGHQWSVWAADFGEAAQEEARARGRAGMQRLVKACSAQARLVSARLRPAVEQYLKECVGRAGMGARLGLVCSRERGQPPHPRGSGTGRCRQVRGPTPASGRPVDRKASGESARCIDTWDGGLIGCARRTASGTMCSMTSMPGPE